MNKQAKIQENKQKPQSNKNELIEYIEWSKSDREGEILYDIHYIWNLKWNDANEFTYKTEIHSLRKWTYGSSGVGIVRDFGKVMYLLLYLKWITNKDLLYSTWNSIQCYVSAWRGGWV